MGKLLGSAAGFWKVASDGRAGWCGAKPGWTLARRMGWQRVMKTNPPEGPREKNFPGINPANAAGAAMFSASAWKAIGRNLKLSGRELEILRGVFDDQTEQIIAVGLNISPHTVHTHVERLYHKLRVANRVQLVLRLMGEFLALTASPAENLPPVCAAWAMGECPKRPSG